MRSLDANCIKRILKESGLPLENITVRRMPYEPMHTPQPFFINIFTQHKRYAIRVSTEKDLHRGIGDIKVAMASYALAHDADGPISSSAVVGAPEMD